MYATPDSLDRELESPAPPLSIRSTRPEDVADLPDLERAAGELFRVLPELAWIADEDPISTAEHDAYVRSGLSWVAVAAEPAQQLIGFLVAQRHRSALHLVELSVHPIAQRRGVGSALLRRGVEEAERLGLAAATLTTFVDVPWNGPFYRRHGFDPVLEQDLSEDLRLVLAGERRAGLPMTRRRAMRRVLR